MHKLTKSGDEANKIMWKEIESKLEEIKIKNNCEEFTNKEKMRCHIKNNIKFGDTSFRKFLDSPEILQEITYRLLDTLTINEGTYVCDVLSPLLDIVMNDLPVNSDVWIEWVCELKGDKASFTSAERKGSYKCARRRDFTVIVKIRRENIEIGYLETGIGDKKDVGTVVEIRCMQKEYGIYENYLLQSALIPLSLPDATSKNIYHLIHELLTLRTGIACTIYKILNTKDNEDSSDSDETKSTVSTPPSTPRSSTVVHSHHSQE
ncbi:hypothetical protein F8M41_010324 [Gigaspora margarita]|uniref:Uncharacterized protein n=1 Tax=Gigaspora margarita TaxID=4874 RepID=A0A8H4A2J5_GIGMA|nr:hypothetical protein F8M41_010324 [Gigaspora margarita]